MATGDLIFASSFQHYETEAAGLPPDWTAWTGTAASAVVGSLATPIFGGRGRYDQALSTQTNSNVYLQKDLGASYAAGTIGFYFRTGTVANASIIMALADSGTLHCDVRYTTAGLITVTRNGTVLATSTNSISINTVYHIELLVTIGDAGTGNYEVKVNGSSVNWIPSAAGDTRNGANASFNELRLYGRAANDTGVTNHRFAHLYVVEGASSVGQYVGHTMRPIGAGYSADFTGNFGSNFLNVADVENDSDNSFNQSATDTNKDSFILESCPTGTIHSVQATLNARQDAGSGHTIRAFLRIGGTNYYGAAKALTATYQMLTWAWTDNPATATGWVTADLASGDIELGYERVS